jgi:hypothetical protein
MPNPNLPRGIIPVQRLDGSPYNGKANIYSVPASNAASIFIGQPVIATGASDANGIPVVTTATAAGGNFLLGPMVGIVDGGEPIISITRDLPVYRQASVAQYILVADDPDLIFEAQEDSVGGNIAMATAGTKNIDLISASGSTVTGFSGWMLDSSTIATTNTLQMRLVSGVRRANNDMGSGTGVTLSKWLCKINLHSLRNTTGI